MLELKKRYNDLLANYQKGADLLSKDPENQDIISKLQDVQLKMNECLMKIGEYTVDETENGFDLTVQEAETVETHVSGENVSQQTEIVPHQPNVINTLDSYKNNWEMAVNLSKSDLVPDTFKGKVENCIIALGIAQQTNLPPYTIMNNLNIVRGRASFSGSFARTLIERTGKYLTLNIKYIGEKGTDSYGAYMEAIRKDGSIVKGPEVTIATAKQERMVF